MNVDNIIKKTVLAAGVTGLMLLSFSASAASEITINQPVTGSTTVVEQYSDGKVATITSTPSGISMRDGMPYAVTQVTTVPRYTLHQGSSTMITTDVVTTGPVTSQVITSPSTTTLTLDALQLNPTFSTPGIVNANTKVMKILKDSNGRDVAVPANSIKPGDIIEYHTTYTNSSTRPISDINAMVSLPNGVRVVSLNSPLPTLATTGGDSYQTIQQVGNTVVVQENYSGLKWNLASLPANSPQTVVIRAKVQ